MPRKRTELEVVDAVPALPIPVQVQAELADMFQGAIRQPDFRAALEREARLQPLAFLSVASKFLVSPRGTAPAVMLNNIITSIPRSPLDDLPEGFNVR